MSPDNWKTNPPGQSPNDCSKNCQELSLPGISGTKFPQKAQEFVQGKISKLELGLIDLRGGTGKVGIPGSWFSSLGGGVLGGKTNWSGFQCWHVPQGNFPGIIPKQIPRNEKSPTNPPHRLVQNHLSGNVRNPKEESPNIVPEMAKHARRREGGFVLLAGGNPTTESSQFAALGTIHSANCKLQDSRRLSQTCSAQNAKC